jgi:uncharacterized protein (DUF1501 family)
MATTRRQFVKRGAGLVGLSMVMPRVWLGEARAQEPAAFNSRKFVIIQLGGGNDGLNTVIPYTNARYKSLRPTLAFTDTEVASTMISSEFAFHPSMVEIKALYDAGKVAIVNGVGYPNQSTSHFLGTDIWMTANLTGGQGNGWLGRYADQFYYGKSGLSAVSLAGALPKALFADKFVTPNISSFEAYRYQTDGRFAGDRNNQLNSFRANTSRSFEPNSFPDLLARAGLESEAGAVALQAAVATYTSPITYPTQGNGLAVALQRAAQIMTTVADTNMAYVTIGGFDNHSQQIAPGNRLAGAHATLLRNFSTAVDAFKRDLEAHGINDVVIMTFSEFGRRPQQNASDGSDHGRAAPLFVIGNPVVGGLYGNYPSLEATALDSAGNMLSNVDFRAVYATILDKWLSADSRTILGGTFADVGFLG